MPSPSEQHLTLPSSGAQGLVANKQSSLAVIVTHPWGPLGGNLHNNVVVAVCRFFQKKRITTLRFDFTGWQLSRGTFQVEQVQEAAQTLLTSLDVEPDETLRPKQILLCGYSYGSLITASASANIPESIGVISIAPPFSVKHWLLLFHSNYHFEQAKKRDDLPRLFLIGDQDNFTSEATFHQMVKEFPESSTTRVVLKDADHFFGRREKDILVSINDWLLKTGIGGN